MISVVQVVNIPESVRRAVLTRIEQYGIGPGALGEELLMQEGCGSFEDFVANIEQRYGPDEAERTREAMTRLAKRDGETRGLGGRRGNDDYDRARALAENLARYALIGAPDAEFLNGVEIGLGMVAERYAEAGTARGSEVQSELAWHIDTVLTKRGIPYRYDAARFMWAGDRGAHQLVVEPALRALADSRLDGSRDELETALRHLRLGTLKDLEDAIEEAAKSVESALKVLAAETSTAVAATATIRPLFDALKNAGVIPPYTDNLIQAAARLRNELAGHGAGSQPRQIKLDEATATVNVAAAALVFLAGRLP